MFTGDEYHTRFGIWLTNKRYIEEHNAGKFSYTLALNKLAHLTQSEYRNLLGYKMNKRERKLYEKQATKITKFTAPDSFDWREKGVVNAIKDQLNCGSCWAFSAVQAQESVYAINTKTLQSLSEQNLIDCVTTCYGCNGGLMTQAYDYVISSQNGQWMLEDDYKYTATQLVCRWDSARAYQKTTGYITIEKGNETDLLEKVVTYGPAAVAVDSISADFHFYDGDIYDEPDCSSEYLDHGVGVVGYGAEDGVKFWIVRNSWGTDWGEDGYIRMSRDKNNQCGIATQASIPTVE